MIAGNTVIGDMASLAVNSTFTDRAVVTGTAFLAQPPPISTPKQTKAIVLRNMEEPSSRQQFAPQHTLERASLPFLRQAKAGGSP
jgi:hypothetical protein